LEVIGEGLKFLMSLRVVLRVLISSSRAPFYIKPSKMGAENFSRFSIVRF
jgi:hypothetical protein